MTTYKICSSPKCEKQGRRQSTRNFGNNTRAADGLHWYCKDCANRIQREWKEAHPKKVKKWKKDYREARA